MTKKRALIVGVANDHSIAWGIAQALHRSGYELAFTFQGDALERRVRPLAESVGSKIILPLDVKSEEQMAKIYEVLGERWGGLDALVHSVAYADRVDLEGTFVSTGRDGFLNSMEVSVYSLVSLVRGALPLFEKAGGGSVVTMSYYGAEKVVQNYNVMGVAKAALESSVRYLANDLGPVGVRVNAVSAGPVRTLAAAGIKGFKAMYAASAERNPLRKHVSLETIGETAAFLLGDGASGITGEVVHVDSGFHVLGG